MNRNPHNDGHRAPEAIKVFQWMAATEYQRETLKVKTDKLTSSLLIQRSNAQAVEQYMDSNRKQAELLKAENDKLSSHLSNETESNSSIQQGMQGSKEDLENLDVSVRQMQQFNEYLDRQIDNFESQVETRRLRQEDSIRQSCTRRDDCAKDVEMTRARIGIAKNDIFHRSQKLADCSPDHISDELALMGEKVNGLVTSMKQKTEELKGKEQQFDAEESLHVNEIKLHQDHLSKINLVAAEQVQRQEALDVDMGEAEALLQKLHEDLAKNKSAHGEVVEKVARLQERNGVFEQEAAVLSPSLGSGDAVMGMSDIVKSMATKVEEMRNGQSQAMLVKSSVDGDLRLMLEQNLDMEKWCNAKLDKVEEEKDFVKKLLESNAASKQSIQIMKEQLKQQLKDLKQEAEETHNAILLNTKTLNETFLDCQRSEEENKKKLEATEEDVSKLGQEYKQATITFQDQVGHNEKGMAMMSALQSSLDVLLETIVSHEEELAGHKSQSEATRQDVQNSYDGTVKRMEDNNKRIRENNAEKDGQIEALKLALEKSAALASQAEHRKKVMEKYAGYDDAGPRKKVAKSTKMSSLFSSDDDDEFFPAKAVVGVPVFPQVDKLAPSGQARSKFKFFKSRN